MDRLAERRGLGSVAAVNDNLHRTSGTGPRGLKSLGRLVELEAVGDERLDVNFAGSNKFNRSRVAVNETKLNVTAEAEVPRHSSKESAPEIVEPFSPL